MRRSFLISSSVLLSTALSSTLNFAIAAPNAESLQKEWGDLLQGTTIDDIKPSPIDGLWEVDAGAHVFYSNEKGDKLILGDILIVEPKEGIVNLTEERRMETRLSTIKSLDLKDMINYKAKKPKHDLYVFTDPDCGYCRKFHNERSELLDAGINIHYLAMPRTPPGSPSYNKSVSIWCADDRQKALTDAKKDAFKNGNKTCAAGEKIVARDVKLARQFGAQGTPTLVLDTGEVIPGYVPAKEIIGYYEEYDETAAK
jgi:thiol:disulfide interchange protein DsbC